MAVLHHWCRAVRVRVSSSKAVTGRTLFWLVVVHLQTSAPPILLIQIDSSSSEHSLSQFALYPCSGQPVFNLYPLVEVDLQSSESWNSKNALACSDNHCHSRSQPIPYISTSTYFNLNHISSPQGLLLFLIGSGLLAISGVHAVHLFPTWDGSELTLTTLATLILGQ